MARTKRSKLPPVTEADRLHHPNLVRSTPNGGLAWTCHYCKRYASDRSVEGRFLCRCHGGSTPRQRDPLQRQRHLEQTGQHLKTPGRPLRHGLYARRKRKVADIRAENRLKRIEQREAWDRRIDRETRELERLERQVARLKK